MLAHGDLDRSVVVGTGGHHVPIMAERDVEALIAQDQ
jgi:hypothetical protein